MHDSYLEIKVQDHLINKILIRNTGKTVFEIWTLIKTDYTWLQYTRNEIHELRKRLNWIYQSNENPFNQDYMESE